MLNASRRYTFNGRGDKYSTFKYGFEHFTGVDYDDKTGDKGIFKIVGENKGWAQAVDKENQNYDYLMGADVDHAHPDVEKDNLLWGDWVLKETGASGFRFDAIKVSIDTVEREFRLTLALCECRSTLTRTLSKNSSSTSARRPTTTACSWSASSGRTTLTRSTSTWTEWALNSQSLTRPCTTISRKLVKLVSTMIFARSLTVH